jgi:hypothetical protein
LWNLSFYFCLCFTTKTFTVGFNYLSRHLFVSFVFLLYRKLHGKTSGTYQDAESNVSNEDHLSVKSLNIKTDAITEIPSTLSQPNGRDKKAFLKSLEHSLRTGEKIQNEDDNENDSQANPFTFICRFMNKRLRRTTTEMHEDTEL